MRLGVFDSGIGGKSIADLLARDFPNAQVEYVQDAAHVPYGGREKEDIISLTETAIQPLIMGKCDCIILACNTATAAAIEYLRDKYPSQKFIGLEPMVKPAVETSKSNIIAVCATPYTLSSERYAELKQQYGEGVTILEPDCSNWAEMIEHNSLDDQSVKGVIQEVLDKGADVIVLACTHYHWIKDTISKYSEGRAVVLDPSDAISRRVASLLELDFVA